MQQLIFLLKDIERDAVHQNFRFDFVFSCACSWNFFVYKDSSFSSDAADSY